MKVLSNFYIKSFSKDEILEMLKLGADKNDRFGLRALILQPDGSYDSVWYFSDTYFGCANKLAFNIMMRDKFYDYETCSKYV